MKPDPIVIIGTGLAGYSTAREFRKLDPELPLIIISADSGYSYSKPMLSNALAKGQAPLDLPNGDCAKMAATLNATVWANRSVDAVLPTEHMLMIDGERIAYGKLVLGVGATQMRLSFEGDAPDAPISVNDLDQYASFRETIRCAKRIAIIGAGLIGSEFANDLIASGHGVEVIELFEYPLGRLVPPEAGHAVRTALEGLGVKWHLGRACERIDRSGQGYALTLSDGSSVHADAILSAVGLKPRTQLAMAAGLEVNRGILVNRHLQTSDPDIYSLGDCMEIEGLVLPYVMPIMHAARALAKTLSGEPTRLSYPVMPVVVKTPAHPVVLSPPHPGAEGHWEVTRVGDGVRCLFMSSAGEAGGFVLTGSCTKERNSLAKELPPVLS